MTTDATEKKLIKIKTINFPTKYADFYLTTYATKYPEQPDMKYVIVVQTKKLSQIPLIRIHSTCLFSEIFKYSSCDCTGQLEKSLRLIAQKKGIFFYLDQEGRGHGIYNKTVELQLQEQGLDTVEASQRLNLPVDNRRYSVVSHILKRMNINQVKIITGNPQKIRDLEKEGIKVVERIAFRPLITAHNLKYLRVKKERLGHLIDV